MAGGAVFFTATSAKNPQRAQRMHYERKNPQRASRQAGATNKRTNNRITE
jgi:hypothetical protein